MAAEVVKENVRVGAVVPLWVVFAAVLATAGALLVAALVDARLPPPRRRDNAPPDTFIAEIAHEHLLNLTALGPRVAGSYESEVAAVAVLVAALRAVAGAASPHNTLDVDLHRATGHFSLSFFDGMNHMYRDVQSVVARARAVGASGAPRTALLINCHYDTVPDSPGASDDAAGCAVALEVVRALVSAPRPLRHPVLLLLNGAEENIMQASHAFVTQHKWARSVRAFINIEACGAGGREVLFQAGPRDPWIMQVYARTVPHPFASSLAQELFESGLVPADTDFRVFRDFGNLSGTHVSPDSVVLAQELFESGLVPADTDFRVFRDFGNLSGTHVSPDSVVLAQELFESGLLPADTDFRVFRDFGNLSGVDLAWSADGYVYHTHLDSAARVRPNVLQRTGDNVLALATGMLESGWLERPSAEGGAPVFFDVLGAVLLTLPPARALLAAALAVGLVLLRVTLNASQASTQLYMSGGAWWAAAAAEGGRQVAAGGAGVAAAAGLAALWPALGPALPYYARPWLVLPLYGLPALAVAALVAGLGGLRVGGRRGGAWWAARAGADGAALVWAGALAGAALLRLRSGYVPLLWAGPPALADLAAGAARLTGGKRACAWAVGAALPVLQTCYLALGSLATLVPVTGRAGQPPLTVDVLIALVTSLLTLATCSWMVPLLRVSRATRPLVSLCLCGALVGAGLALVGPVYTAQRPQRLMVFHVRRTQHDRVAPVNHTSPADHYYWVPQLDDNTPHTLDNLPGWGGRVSGGGAECSRWVYCGAPYYLPVLGRVTGVGRAGVGRRGGVLALGVLRRALLPAGAGSGPALAPAARAAAAAAARQRARSAAAHRWTTRLPPQPHHPRAVARGGGGIPGGGRAGGAARPARGRGVGRAAHVLRVADGGAPAPGPRQTVGPHAAHAGGARVGGGGGAGVGGRARDGGRAGGRARAAAVGAAAARGAHRLARRPAPLPPLARTGWPVDLHLYRL